MNLVTSKSRVAPSKEQGLPRLELLGNLTAVRLAAVILSALSEEYEFSNYFCWTDSQVALAWIKAVEKEFNVFLLNRAVEIRK